MILFDLLQQRALAASGAWERFSPQSIKTIKGSLRIYLLFMLLGFFASAFLFLHPSRIAETAWGMIALLCSIVAMVMHHKGMERERSELGIP